jgi:hypothetical protein
LHPAAIATGLLWPNRAFMRHFWWKVHAGIPYYGWAVCSRW